MSCSIFSELCAVDLTKTVRIRDIRLGVLYYVLITIIGAYIVIVELVRNNQYLAYYEPSAAVRLDLQQPTANHCNPNIYSCEDNFSSIPSLNYCCQQHCTLHADDQGGCTCPERKFTNYACEFLDGSTAGIVLNNAILITTFEKKYKQGLNKSCGLADCTKLWELQSRPDSYFVVDIEKFTLLIDHSVTQADLNILRTSREMTGWLAVNGTHPLQENLCSKRQDAVTAPVGGVPTDHAPCYIRPETVSLTNNLDIFKIETLLHAMGHTLDDSSYSGSGHSLRYEGLAVILQIQYFNSWPWHGILRSDNGQPFVSYIYNLLTLDTTPYKADTMGWLHFPDMRLKTSAHGIHFAVAQGGRLAVFSPLTLLMTLTASLALMAIAAVIVRYVATYMLRKRHYFREFIYDVSPDFRNINMLEGMSNRELEAVLQRRQQDFGPSRTSKIIEILRMGSHQEPQETMLTSHFASEGSTSCTGSFDQ